MSSTLDTHIWRVRPLVHADLEDCYRLSCEAGWNQTRKDWSFIIENAESLGVERIGEGIVATTVAFSHAGIRWIAMVLTAKAWRGNGLASEILRLIKLGGTAAVDCLDATSFGAPLYERFGFVTTGRVIRYHGHARSGIIRDAASAPIRKLSTDNPLMQLSGEWEETASGGVSCPAMTNYFIATFKNGCLAMDNGEHLGAVWTRPGRVAWQIGPLVAAHFEDAAQLLHTSLGTITGDVFIDVPAEMKSLATLLEELGFVPAREFLRMRCGEKSAPRPFKLKRWATAGPDFG